MGSLQPRQGVQQHNPSSKHEGCGVIAGLHFVLPVSDGQSPTDDLCSALPACRGGGPAMILLLMAFFLLFVP